MFCDLSRKSFIASNPLCYNTPYLYHFSGKEKITNVFKRL